MTFQAPTTRDVFFSHWGSGTVERWSLGGTAEINGGYRSVWTCTGLESQVIGMTDDGRFLYVATWQASRVQRIDMATGAVDPGWSIRTSDAGLVNGDLESLTIRVKNGRTTLITGWADPALLDDPANPGHAKFIYWAEWDIATRELIQAHDFVNRSRGCDWVWMINADEFVTGTEHTAFWRINVETLEETLYLNAPGGVSYTIEVRLGRFIAVTGNSGPIVTGHCNPITGHDPVLEQVIYITIPGIYFASSIESDGRFFWFSNYNGPDDTGKTPVYRVNTLTGEGRDAPIFHLDNGLSTQGIYCPFRIHGGVLKGEPGSSGVRFDPINEPSGDRMLAVNNNG